MVKGKRMIFLTLAMSIVLVVFSTITLSVNSVNAQSVDSVQEVFLGNGNGENGKFIAAIEAPVEGSRGISSVEELQKIGAAGGYSLDGHYHLTADIDLNGIEWKPIGTSSSRFTGIFDGQGHVIRNLTITGTYECAGLFGYVGGMYYNGQSGPYYHTPNFKNIGLEDINIDVSSTSTIIKVGGIFGDNHRGDVTVSNCYVTGQMRAESMTAYVGGLAGITTGYNPSGRMTIKDSYNGAAVYAKGNSYNEAGASVLNVPVVEAGFASAGGLVGWGADVYAVTNCHNLGKVTSDSTGASNAGGILGFGFVYELDQVSLCSNRGDVKALSEDKPSNTGQRINYSYAGGIIGYDSPNERITTITSCYNEGNVSAELTSANTEVEVYAGGIGGRLNNQTISDCFNKGTISAYNVDNTSGYAAGISGRVSSKSNVRRTYNTGTISGAKTGAIAGLSLKESVIRSNFYQSGSATKGVAEGEGEEGSVVLSIDQMKLEKSFKGYNFSKIWGFKTDENDNMPILQGCYSGFHYNPTGEVPGAGYDFLAKIEAPKEGSYPIGTVEELIKIGKEDGLPLTWDYHLTANLDLTGISWEPINDFRGVFDGQGYVIHNLEIVGDYNRAGLFGEIKSDYYNTHRPILKNIALENVYINTVSKSYTQSYVGGLLGNNDKAIVSISNCYVTGKISNSAAIVQTGGLVGRNGGYYSDMFHISDCQNFASIESIGSGSAGGMLAEAGYVEMMDNCHNYGRITSTATSDFCAAGGVIANLYNGNTIKNCCNSGDVTVLSTSAETVDAGGIAAYSSTSAEGVVLKGCYNMGNISATFNTATANTSGELYAGGIGGRAIGLNISDSYNTGNISAIHNWNKVGDTGGIAGVLKDGSIRKSYSTGNITASKYAGGIIGSNIGYGFTKNTYWNSDASFIKNNVELQVSEKKGVGSGEDTTTSKTATQLQQEATFAGFEFGEIWGLQQGINTDYPILCAFKPNLDYVSTTSSATPQKKFIVKDFNLPSEGSKPIATREDLDNMRNDLTGSYHLVADIDLTGIDWVPIGDNATNDNASRFSGTFDGQGHVITGLEVITLEKGAITRYSGLFGYIDGTADIRNLGLEDVYISNSSWTPYAGGIFAYSSASKNISIDNCYITGEIKSTNGGYIGGIAGYIKGASSYLTNCYNSAKVTSNSGKSYAGYAGGITGYLSDGKIAGCYNTGEVSMFQAITDSAVGGISGCINYASEIVNSYNKGKITMHSNANGYAGGIAGCVNGEKCKISTSYNKEEIFATTTSTATSVKVEAGGIAGKSAGSIEDSFNASHVMASASGNNVNVGGIVGESYSTSVVSKCYSSGNITTGTNLGGIAGIVAANAMVKESYWNNEATHKIGSIELPQSTKKGIGNGTGTSVGLTIAQMKQQSNYEKFDFDNVWSITADENDGFPMLKSQKCLYTVNVFCGSGGSGSSSVVVGSWGKGETVSIVAPAASSSYRFKEWTATDIVLAHKDNAEITFTMPAKNISLTATYEKIPNHTLTVNNGSGGGSIQEGTKVCISASVLSGKTFKEWIADDESVQFENKTSSNTTFIMPNKDVKVEAVYEDTFYTITINGGTASFDSAKAGELITIKANEPEEGKCFKQWKTANRVSFSDVYNAETTFVMPCENITIIAQYENLVKKSQVTPSAPTLFSKTSTSVTLNIISGAEYRCNGGVWQDSPVFSGLTPNTTYSFSVRMKETQTHKASASSANLSVKTNADSSNAPSSDVMEQPKDGIQDNSSNTETTTIKRKKALTPVISKQPKSKTLKRKAKYTLSVKAKVKAGKLTYQWQKSTKKKKGFKNISGAASKKRTYKVPAKKKGTIYYRCIITNTDKNAISTKSKKVSKTVTIKIR